VKSPIKATTNLPCATLTSPPITTYLIITPRALALRFAKVNITVAVSKTISGDEDRMAMEYILS
jgi:hypothetical protein